MIYRNEDLKKETRENMRGGSGSAVLTALCPDLPEKLRLFSKIELAPGSSIGEHMHEHEAELFYFVSGTATLIDDGEKKPAKAGDVMLTPHGHCHSVINDGGETLVMIACIVKDA